MKNAGSRWKAQGFILGASLCMTLLTGCGQNAAPELEFDILRDAKPIPLAVTQALSISTKLNIGLSPQALDSVHITTVRSNDLKGYPFMDITITTPEEVEDLWTYARQLTGEEWAGDSEDSPWSVTLTGATDARDTFVSSNVGLDLIRDVVKTIDAMGGPTKLEEVIAVEAEIFVLRDIQGQLWNIDTKEMLTAEEVQYVTDTYNEMYEAHNSPEVAQSMQSSWNKFISTNNAATRNAPLDWQALTQKDGSLNLHQFKELTAELRPATVFSDGRGCLGACITNNGEIHSTRQAHRGGGYQSPSYFGRSSDWKMPWCVATSSVKTTDQIGCAPSAFIGLIWRKWVDGTPVMGRSYSGLKGFKADALNYYYPYFHKDGKDSIAHGMTEPNGLRGRPMIANFMGTCWNSGGSMTTAGGFVGGAKGFLSRYATRLELKSNYSEHHGNVAFAGTKAKMLKQEIGKDNNPVVAEYFRGIGKGHFSPVTVYQIYNGATIGVNVKTMDDRGKFHSLSASWGTQRGVFYLEKK